MSLFFRGSYRKIDHFYQDPNERRAQTWLLLGPRWSSQEVVAIKFEDNQAKGSPNQLKTEYEPWQFSLVEFGRCMVELTISFLTFVTIY